jgi:hypothetical protein
MWLVSTRDALACRDMTGDDTVVQAGQSAAPDDATPKGLFGSGDRIELFATIVLAVATVLTAWSAFQSAKWSGHQSINFAEAGAARTESTRADTRAGQLAQVDVAMFIDWVAAIFDDAERGAITLDSGTTYEPTAGTLSGFLYLRFRDEFRPAVDAWLATDPVNNPDAPTSPFVMADATGQPVYQLAVADEADALILVAEENTAEARQDNQNSDNYVITMVLFASVLFFAGMSSKLVKPRNRLFALGFGVVLLIAGLSIVVSLPKLTLRA